MVLGPNHGFFADSWVAYQFCLKIREKAVIWVPNHGFFEEFWGKKPKFAQNTANELRLKYKKEREGGGPTHWGEEFDREGPRPPKSQYT